MKKIVYTLIASALIFISCSDPGGDPIYDGFKLQVSNRTNTDYNIEIVIGGKKNGIFIPTDSIKMNQPVIKKKSNYYFIEDNRWMPDLSKIKALPSDSCYFKLKLSNQRVEFIKRFNQQKALNLQLPNKNYYTGDYGWLLISIWDDKITGYAAEEQ